MAGSRAAIADFLEEPGVRERAGLAAILQVTGHFYIFSGVGSDDGNPIHYAAVKRGTPVYAADGRQVGVVDEVVDNYREHILDGFVIENTDGELRFVDAPEVARTAERAVRLTIDSAAGGQLPTPEQGRPRVRPATHGPARQAARRQLAPALARPRLRA